MAEKALEAAELKKACELRAQLESFAARNAARNAAKCIDDRRTLRTAATELNAAIRADDYSEFRKADTQLHTAIIRIARIPFLHESWLPVWSGLHELHEASFHDCWPDLRVLSQEHKHLVDDICRGDAEAAANTAREHVSAVWYRKEQLEGLPEDADPLQRATAFIAFRLASPLKLEEVTARAAFVSPGHLSRLFRQRYGVGFQKHLQTLRLDKAASLLRETRLPVGAVARRVGYNDTSRFGQHFKRRHGLSPNQYRKQEKGRA